MPKITVYIPVGQQIRSATENAWNTMEETLAMDSRAKNFASDLREEISGALKVLHTPPKEPADGLIAVTVETPRGHQLRAATPDAWGTIDETLDMDTQSKAFDPSLRSEIARALGNMRCYKTP